VRDAKFSITLRMHGVILEIIGDAMLLNRDDEEDEESTLC
jgi:hypothetical protein